MRYFLLALVLFYTQNSQAAQHAYQFPDSVTFEKFQSFRISQVLDSIPQLRVLAIDQENAPEDAIDLGPIKTIHLENPSTKLGDVPKGYWGLEAIDVRGAWRYSQGEGVVVAISDTGISQVHADLAANIWKNPGETGVDTAGQDKSNNQIDDDGNGYIDDVSGWNFVKKAPALGDNQYHGTHVSGTVAAVYGPKISGVAPKAKLMTVAFLGADGSGTELNAAKTLIYAADNGARIINCSWGGEGKSALVDKAVHYANQKGVLVVAAAGNNSKNIDRTYFMPASSNAPNLLVVGATQSLKGNKADFSNFGPINVDIAAPGYNIRSASVGRGYQLLSGTSMSTPHVSGTAALVWSLHPEYSVQQVKAAIMESAVPNAKWQKKSVTGAVLNARRAVEASR
jgi:thermitase